MNKKHAGQTGVTVKGISISHPKNKVGNEHFRELYSEKGVDIEKEIHVAGRKYRYIADNTEENTLTMAIDAVKKVLAENNLKGEDIDMLVFSSDTPEYMAPSNSLLIHKAIEGKAQTILYDMNANCVGMMIAFEQVNSYMRANKHINRAIVVGSQQLSRNAKEETVLPYISFGDAATAVLLERTNDDAGIIDSSFHIDSSAAAEIMIPPQGFSNTEYDGKKEKDLHWDLESRAYENATSAISEILVENNTPKEEVKKYFVSQFVHREILRIAKELGEDESKFTYVGHKYGYTGTTSPFLAFAEALNNGQVGRGDTIVMWSVGAGWNTCALLLKL